MALPLDGDTGSSQRGHPNGVPTYRIRDSLGGRVFRNDSENERPHPRGLYWTRASLNPNEVLKVPERYARPIIEPGTWSPFSADCNDAASPLAAWLTLVSIRLAKDH